MLVADKLGFSILCLRGFSLQSLRTPGFTGVINSETVTPDTSRRRGIDVELEPILDRARLAVQPSVSSGLNALGKQGFSANRLDQLAWCCESYGPESILGSTFRFIQLVEPDGSSRFVSAMEFAEALTPASSLFVGFGAGPNKLLKNWHSRLTESPDSKLGVCFAEIDIMSFGYLSSDEPKTGSLDDLWSDRDGAPLFSMFIGVVEKAWGVENGSLASQDGWVHQSTELSAFLRRA